MVARRLLHSALSDKVVIRNFVRFILLFVVCSFIVMECVQTGGTEVLEPMSEEEVASNFRGAAHDGLLSLWLYAGDHQSLCVRHGTCD